MGSRLAWRPPAFTACADVLHTKGFAALAGRPNAFSIRAETLKRRFGVVSLARLNTALTS
jgi:hypothetical protein